MIMRQFMSGDPIYILPKEKLRELCENEYDKLVSSVSSLWKEFVRDVEVEKEKKTHSPTGNRSLSHWHRLIDAFYNKLSDINVSNIVLDVYYYDPGKWENRLKNIEEGVLFVCHCFTGRPQGELGNLIIDPAWE